MADFLWNLFKTSDFVPRWNCGNWSSAHGWLHIISDLGVWSAYVTIPCVLGYFILRKRDLPFQTIFWLFAAFILACGSTHLMEAIIFWWPAYRLAALIKLFTAIVSWATVLAIVPIVPKALSLRSPHELETEIVERKKAEAALRVTQGELEERVRRRTADLESSNAALQAEIAERKKAQQDREHLLESERAARNEAERMSRVKDDFLATLSHELRTPINAIYGWAQLLQIGSLTSEEMQESFSVIVRNSQVQVQLIDDLLDVSRIVSGKLRLDVQPVDLCHVIQSALSTVSTASDAKGIQLQSILDPAAGPVSGDPGRLQQVVWNLLSNAVKFTSRGGKVQIRLQRVNSQIEIIVADTGEGLSPVILPHIFERFWQADGSTTRKHRGLGLGLSIVRQLVELHGGTVSVQSPGPGQGTTFTVSLPLSAVHPSIVASERLHPAGPSPQVTECPTTLLEGLRILVVDDEPDGRALVKRSLSGSQAEVADAGSVAEALKLLEQFKPHLLVSDIGMPEQDGYELIRQVRATNSARELPAIALTAFARSEDRRRILMAGFQIHMAKPVETYELIAAIASLVGRTGNATPESSAGGGPAENRSNGYNGPSTSNS
jgi:signal transduction histidine kinase/ActR/RegA family two-component response regulator